MLYRIYFYMEFSYNKLKKLDVISLADGKNLGKFCDVKLTLPEGKVIGFYASGCKGFKLGKAEVFIPISGISKIGEDAILVKPDKKPPKPPPKWCKPDCPPPPLCPPPFDDRRSFDDYE